MFGELKVQLRNESYEQLRTGFTSSSPFSAKKDKTRERKTFVVCLFICSFFWGESFCRLFSASIWITARICYGTAEGASK